MITPTRSILEAALEGFEIQRKAIEARQQEIREALKSPVEVMADAVNHVKVGTVDSLWQDRLRELKDRGIKVPGLRPKRQMTAAGRAAISRATKARWAKYRKEKSRA